MATPSPNDLTRQQLDELDVLLQRMLALPLNKPEPTVAYSPPPPLPDVPAAPTRPTANGWRSDTPAAKVPHLTPERIDESVFTPAFLPAPAGASPVAAKTQPARPEPAPRLYAPPSPAAEFAPTSGGPGTLRGVDAPAMPFGYTPREPLPPVEEPEVPSAFAGMNFAEVNPFADPPSAETPNPIPATSTSPPVPILLWPLFALNAVIEYLLGWFGPLGHLLTRPWMKTLLGWVGVLLLVGAGLWAARGKGWVSWPR